MIIHANHANLDVCWFDFVSAALFCDSFRDVETVDVLQDHTFFRAQPAQSNGDEVETLISDSPCKQHALLSRRGAIPMARVLMRTFSHLSWAQT